MTTREICNRSLWTSVQKINKGWSKDMKFHVIDKEGHSFVLRTAKEEHKDRFKKEFQYIKALYEMGISTHKPMQVGVCYKDKYCFQLLSYIEGDQAEILLPKMASKKQYALGRKMGEELQRLHSAFPISGVNWEEQYNRKIDQYIKNYHNCIMKDPLIDAYIKFVNDHRYLLKNRPVCQLHGDFHVGNIIIDPKDQPHMIDFNRMKLGDPWYEFNRIYFSFRVSPNFAKGLIEGYFAGEVPSAFFLYMKFYLLSIMIATLPWSIPFGEDDIAFAKKSIQTVYDTYDGLHRVRPKWYDALGDK